jgi:hypothetical protein
MAQIVIRPLDQIMAKYARQLQALGTAKANKVMARALNYEGARNYTLVKRAIRNQSSVAYEAINKGTKFRRTATSSATLLTTAIEAKGEYLLLKYFKPKQLKKGVSATVWGKRQRYRGAFGAPGDNPNLVARLGTPFHRLGKSRLPIKPLYGANLAVEMVKDNPPKVFLASGPRIVDRIEKEIAAVLRGY